MYKSIINDARLCCRDASAYMFSPDVRIHDRYSIFFFSTKRQIATQRLSFRLIVNEHRNICRSHCDFSFPISLSPICKPREVAWVWVKALPLWVSCSQGNVPTTAHPSTATHRSHLEVLGSPRNGSGQTWKKPLAYLTK